MERDPLWCRVFADLDRQLAAHLARLRNRGKAPFADTVPDGFVSDDEAGMLVAALVAAHAAPPPELASDSVSELPLALSRLVARFGLDRFELQVMVVALAAELDTRYARLFAFLNDHAAHQRPTIGLTIALHDPEHAWRPDKLRAFATAGRLQRFALIELEGEGPFATQAIRVPVDLWPRLIDLEAPSPVGDLVDSGPGIEDLVLDAAVRTRARAVANELRAGATAALVRGPTGSGRDAMACALALELGSRALVFAPTVPSRLVAREARWHDAIPIVSAAAASGLDDVATPIIVIAGDEPCEDLREKRSDLAEIVLSRPSLGACRELWHRQIPAELRAPSLELASVAARFPMSPRRIASVGARARRQHPRGDISTQELLDACREFPDRRFETVAERLTTRSSWDDLIVPAETRRELDLVIAWASGGRFALDELGISSTGGHGLACLFHGSPGTGKTMAAQVLASTLGLSLVRIDLSQVVNKYIGETEKNLARVFDAAGEANAILFFDEADSLFAKRTAVKDSTDRFANLETGFLLQRLDSHDGLTILATNLRSNLDDAFLRRLHVLAEFPLPDAGDRRRIWDRTLPHGRAEDIDLEMLASRFKFSGGEIRNVVVTAVLLASCDRREVAMRDIVRATMRELKKGGRIVNVEDFGAWRGDALRAMVPRASS